jgi:hypothetical protein
VTSIWSLDFCAVVRHAGKTLFIVIAFAVSACGGGGGYSDDSASQNGAGGIAGDTPNSGDDAGAGDSGSESVAAGDGNPEAESVPEPGADPGSPPQGDPAPLPPQEPPQEEEPPADAPPSANAGRDTGVSERTIVYLDANESSDAEGSIASFRWDQVSGAPVALADPLAARTSFEAPSVQGSQSLSFELTVTDSANNEQTDTIVVTVVDSLELPDDPNEFLSFIDDLSPLYAGTQASAEAYYRAIDPLNEKTNLSDWLSANGFDAGADARAVYRNAADLGFGRVMSLRTLNDGSVAAYVENYATLDEAVDADETGNRAGLLATVAMEFSPGPSGGEPYTKFYTFGPDDARVIAIDLDGRGAKFMPGLCNVCHGGQPQPLVGGEFPDGGRTDAQFLPWDLETYEFSQRSGYTRAEQEAALKVLNIGSLSTYPAAATQGLWSGRAARELIEGWYGGTALPAAIVDPAFVPEGWRSQVNGGPQGNPSGIEDLYLQVVAPNCRACHIMRGRYFSEHPEGELIDFAGYSEFMAWEDRLEALTYDGGTMPDALVTFEQFWGNHDGVIGAELLARYLDVDATQRRPGRPLADPGPDRDVALGTVALNGSASAFAEEFDWTFAAGGRPAGSAATINGANTATPTITTDVPGVYRLQLVVRNNGESSEPAIVTLMALFGTEPVRYSADILPIVTRSCTSCHSEGRAQSVPGIPVRYDEPLALYERLRAYVNTRDYSASPLLSKPAGVRHGGRVVPGFDLSGDPGSTREDYDRILQWIGEGALQN